MEIWAPGVMGVVSYGSLAPWGKVGVRERPQGSPPKCRAQDRDSDVRLVPLPLHPPRSQHSPLRKQVQPFQVVLQALRLKEISSSESSRFMFWWRHHLHIMCQVLPDSLFPSHITEEETEAQESDVNHPRWCSSKVGDLGCYGTDWIPSLSQWN